MGNPPREYTNNDTEAANFMVKYGLNFDEKKPHEFISEIKKIISIQFNNEDRAVFGKGPYRVSEKFQHLAINDTKWSTMTHAQRMASVRKFQDSGIAAQKSKAQFSENSPSTSLLRSTGSESLKMSMTALSCGITSIPMPVLQTLFEKAKQLLSKKGHIVPQPGASNGAYIVAGHSNKIYIVTPGKGGSLACDRACPNHSTKLCEHILAVAEVHGSLKELIAWYKRSKKGPSLTNLAVQGGPKSAGRKPSSRKRSNGKKTPIAEYVNLLSDDQQGFPEIDIESGINEILNNIPTTCEYTPVSISSPVSAACQVASGHQSTSFVLSAPPINNAGDFRRFPVQSQQFAPQLPTNARQFYNLQIPHEPAPMHIPPGMVSFLCSPF